MKAWIVMLALAGCRGGAADGGADGSATTDSSSSADATDGESSGDASESASEGWNCEPPFCDMPPPAECGNGEVEGLEECDGELDHATCEDCVIVCDADWWDCNAEASDACEIHLSSDSLNCGDCGRDCLGATCEDGACLPVVIVEGEPAPMNVAVDATHVYWTNFQNAGSVVRATIDGEDRTVLTSATQPFDIAVDDDTVFFTSDDAIRRVAKSPGASTPLITGTGAARGLAIDANDVFYVDPGVADAEIERVQKAGGGETVLAPAQNSPRSLTVMDGFVYWTDDTAQSVSRTATDGLGPVEVLSTEQVGAWDIFSTPDLVGWTNLADVGQIKWLALDDLMDERILAFPVRPWGITIDEDYVYWTAEGDGTVGRSAVDGEQELAEVIADGQTEPHGIASDENFLYWADTAAGTIVRLTK